MGEKAARTKIPWDSLHDYLRRYQAQMHRDVSTDKAHVYYSRPVQRWITVMKKGDLALLTFTEECPCSRTLQGLTPW